jgi:hypothetical protein
MSRWTQADLEAYSSRVKKLRAVAAPQPVAVPAITRKAANESLGRMPVGMMNKTETLYALELELRKHAGDVVWYKFEGMKFRLANKSMYTPDFNVLLSSGQLECHEVKGFWRDDARLKIKVAASMYPIKFIAVTKRTQKHGGGWSVEDF